ncbi:MAG: DUF4332 domain-containing protein [Hyphomicrobium sp.]
MSLIYRILRAAHARGTHHKLALDALHRMRSPDAAAWERLFLKHAELYMTGAKAPDDEFKDFKNHVLHPRDKYWGGAPEKVASWYAHLVAALRAEKWSEAVWCAGVLSHYATDPVHPFHTAQSEAENNIHRAAEWSINRSYDALWADAIARHADLDIAIPKGPHWIKDLVCASADRSNADYEKLIAHYDITRGVVEPTEGLDAMARPMVGELLVHAATLHGRLLDCAIAEAGVAAPNVSLTLEGILALITMPIKALLKKLADGEDRRIVEAMYDELKTTGRVEVNLPADDRAVRDLYAVEVLAPRAAKLAQVREARLPTAPEAVAAQSRLAALAAIRPKPPTAVAKGGISIAHAVPVPAVPVPAEGIDTAPPPAAAPVAEPAPSAAAESSVTSPTAAKPEIALPARSLQEALSSVPLIPRPAPPRPAATVPSIPPVAEPLSRLAPRSAAAPGSRDTAAADRSARRTLAATDDLEAAPSIGPKTAERFAMAGIRSVADFLTADPDATALKLGARHITPEVIVEWQDQARLVMSIPGLRGGHAQLLTGAGFRSVTAIAEAGTDELCVRILEFATTADGQRILRDGNPPDVERIKSWIDSAATALAA